VCQHCASFRRFRLRVDSEVTYGCMEEGRWCDLPDYEEQEVPGACYFAGVVVEEERDDP